LKILETYSLVCHARGAHPRGHVDVVTASISRMSEHRYTKDERRTHLLELERSLDALLAGIRKTGQCLEYVPKLENVLLRTRELLVVGFDQETLTALSKVIPKLFYLHPHWVPPGEIGPGGLSMICPWFTTLEPLDQAVTERAEQLRVVGTY
jgi:hypothetical protein